MRWGERRAGAVVRHHTACAGSDVDYSYSQSRSPDRFTRCAASVVVREIVPMVLALSLTVSGAAVRTRLAPRTTRLSLRDLQKRDELHACSRSHCRGGGPQQRRGQQCRVLRALFRPCRLLCHSQTTATAGVVSDTQWACLSCQPALAVPDGAWRRQQHSGTGHYAAVCRRCDTELDRRAEGLEEPHWAGAGREG